MVRAEVRWQWVGEGMGNKEEMTVTIESFSKDLQLEKDMRPSDILF